MYTKQRNSYEQKNNKIKSLQSSDTLTPANNSNNNKYILSTDTSNKRNKINVLSTPTNNIYKYSDNMRQLSPEINLNEISCFRYRNSNECISILNKPSIQRYKVNMLNGRCICQCRWKFNDCNQLKDYHQQNQSSFCNLCINDGQCVKSGKYLSAEHQYFPIPNIYIANAGSDYDLPKHQPIIILEIQNECREKSRAHKSKCKKSTNCCCAKKIKPPSPSNSLALVFQDKK